MKDFQKALKISFETIRNVGIAALPLGGAVLLANRPELSLGFSSLGAIEALLLVVLSIVLQVSNICNFALEIRELKISKWLYVIGGVVVIVLLMQLYSALGLSTVLSAKKTLGL